MQAVVSIHDVMPSTLSDVETIIDTLPRNCVSKLTLLIVPGLAWTPDLVKRLEHFQELGIDLAGHGWHHQCSRIRGIYHYIHSKCFSRLAAEHLSMDRAQLRELLEKNYRWFTNNNLHAPCLYVPPAWAKGRLTNADLMTSPFQVIESFTGVHRLDDGVSRVLPLAGFEADSFLRAVFLKMWNKLNVAVASDSIPLRIAIHPNDLKYKLKGDIPMILKKVKQFVNYQDITQGKDF